MDVVPEPNPLVRPRRLRVNPAMRAMVAETAVEPRQLILPVFVAEGLSQPRPISSMPGVVQHTLESVRKVAAEVADAGLAGIMLFGVPTDDHKDATGSAALAEDGILNVALRTVRDEVGDATLVMSDVCLDEFTDHGHCGVLTPAGVVDNDATVEIYAAMARVSTPRAGGSRGGAQRDDGRPGRRHPLRAGRRRSHRGGDHGLRGQVRVRVLRAFP